MPGEITYREAIGEALREEMQRDDSVFLLGEDIGVYGGAFGVTKGLQEEFGEERVIDTPLAESAIVGACIGAALMKMRPVGEIMFADWITIAMDQIVNNAAKMRYLSAGKFSVPLVIRTAYGRVEPPNFIGPYHSQSLESWFLHVPGIKVVVPSSPADAKGLLISAIRDNDPVLFFEHKSLYPLKGVIPEELHPIPLGKADIKRVGKDVTIIATGLMVHKALSVAKALARKGRSLEVIDLRTLVPLDKERVLSSVKKIGRVVLAHEACKTGGWSAEVSATIAEEALDCLKAPVQRVAAFDSPIPHSRLEDFILPGQKEIMAAVERFFE